MLTNQLPNLSTSQLKQLADTMLDAAIAYESGGDWKMILRRARNRKVGLVRRIYDLLLRENDFEKASKCLGDM